MSSPDEREAPAPGSGSDGATYQADTPVTAPALQADESLIVDCVKGSGPPLEDGAVHLTEHERR